MSTGMRAVVETEKDEEESYDMSRNAAGYTGLCVIFNIVTFAVNCLPTRKGSDKDVEAITETFIPFGFKVVEQKDKTKAEIESFLEQTARDIDPTYRCFVCFFLSHGGRDEYMCDAEGVGVNIRELAERFDAKNCHRMVAKPKLFFAQMCRGVDVEEYERNSSLYDSADLAGLGVVQNAPPDQDKLIAYATSPGRMSRLDQKKGSDFIQALTKILKEKGHKWDISGILRRVRCTVAKLNPGDNYAVCPQEDNTLTKRLIFTLKNKPAN